MTGKKQSKPLVVCEETEMKVSYTLENVYDYFPYGAISRKYNAQEAGEEEKYLTTQHQRDTETNLVYRSPRYYDSDVFGF